MIMLQADGLAKAFTLHLQDGARIPVLGDASLTVHAGECVALSGPSGAGKSTLMRCLYGNYRADAGRVLVRHRGALVDIARAEPRLVLEVRRESLGYVSQFLRVVPRVSARNIVAEAGGDASLLTRLNISARLQALPPATFSGGEQQRVNIARGFAGGHKVLLLDEPTASLDPANRDVVVEMILEAKARGAAVVGIFHDAAVRDAVADRLYSVTPLQDAA
jgi:alpha-D-ribose 1-methylphosphonate 5-triphosphate synthase subunit PhnL